jgi:AraC-like DNA-binding protein
MPRLAARPWVRLSSALEIGRTLERVKAEIARGCTPAESAYDTSFTDQSHMTRHFNARFGLTPDRYAALVRGRERVKR